MIGANTPRFFARKRKGDLLPHTSFFRYEANTDENSYSNSWKTSTTKESLVVKGTGSHTAQDEYEVPEFDAGYGSLLLEVIGIDAGPYLQDAAAAINGRGHDTLTFLAELAKVRNMFANVVKRLIKLAKNPRDIDHLASLWLEGRYGWRTLRFDLIDLEGAIRDFDVKKRRYTETRGTTFSHQIYTDTVASSTAGTYHTYQTIDCEVGVRGVITADIQPARFRYNIAVTAWELVPFSFVVDWLVTIGKSLESAVFLASVSNYSACTGTKVTARKEETVGDLEPGSGIHTWNFTRKEVELGTWIFRTPTKVSLNPTVRPQLNTWKAIDLLALIRQLTKPKRS